MSIGILLGGGITNSGQLPYDAKTRVKKALQLMKAGKISHLILSGKCSHGNPKTTEAKLYQEYLIKHGVNKSKLILEEESMDTIGNAVFSKKIVIKHNLSKNIVVITSNYHMKRVLMVFKHIFGGGFSITGVSSYPILPHILFRKFKEWEHLEVNKIILSEIPIGDHEKAESLLPKDLNKK